ncbi:MAG: ATP-dependent DNA helicase RecG, partial [Candidatus Eremiobacteraeota bacterium]|nr:ATP-dependent DNA helicase RecG [Candidatus Eremiobacteraeota bacterium]
MEPAELSRSLSELKGVGPQLLRKFATLEIHTAADLAATYPRSYKDWRVPTPVAEIIRATTARAGDPEDVDSTDEIAVGRIASVSEFRGRVPIVSAQIDDGSGRLKATWFGRRGLKLVAGERIFVHGRAALKRTRGVVAVELNVLHHRLLDQDETYAGAVVPVYRASKDVPSRLIAGTIERNFDALAALVREDIPQDVLRTRGYGSLRDAWRDAHRPATPEAAEAARERLIYSEFFGIALAAAVKRAERRAGGGAPELVAAPGLLERFEDSLPFRFTAAQRRVIAEIWDDMAQPSPMNRLVQGDVGSGKTLVAAAAIVLAASRGVQSALMAPTEILASQHAQKLAPLLLQFGIRVDALFGSMGTRERSATRARLASGECDLVVGTHALIVDGVDFRELGLAVIDEQHRFGVAQRAKLRAKSRAPHTLHMTATPIPRTLAQTKYADLDLSTIDELPPGRTPIATYVIRQSRKHRAYDFVLLNIARGHQAYVVAPAIDESESALTSALAELEILRRGVFASVRVALLHGRLPAREKDAVMSGFARGDADVLLATTVIEVGVDVPNASVMVILDAHNYGLAQLHQLRGRVGRGAARSFCVLIAPDSRVAVERLEILERTADGFKIAEEDLRLRGEGEFAGTAQAGGASGLFGSLHSDFALYARAKADADALVVRDPELSRPEHAVLRARASGDAGSRATLL